MSKRQEGTTKRRVTGMGGGGDGLKTVSLSNDDK